MKNSPVVPLSLPRKPFFPTWLLRLQPVLCFLQYDRFMYVAVCFCVLIAVRGGVIARERTVSERSGAIRGSMTPPTLSARLLPRSRRTWSSLELLES